MLDLLEKQVIGYLPIQTVPWCANEISHHGTKARFWAAMKDSTFR